jgi:hypothetical protein
MEEYVECYGTSLVPFKYSSLNGYKLGIILNNVRHKGTFLAGHPLESDRRKWLEMLPMWTWNPIKCSDALAAIKDRQSIRMAKSHAKKVELGLPTFVDKYAEWKSKLTEEELHSLRQKIDDAHRTPGYRCDASAKKSDWWKNSTQETIASAIRNMKRSKNSDESRQRQASLNRKWNETASAERLSMKAARIASTKLAAFESSLVGLCDEEQAVLIAKRESIKRKNARQKRVLIALRKVSGWEKASNADIAKARRAGVLPSID